MEIKINPKQGSMHGLKDMSYKNLTSDSDPMRKGLCTPPFPKHLHRSRVLTSTAWARRIIGSVVLISVARCL